MQPDDDEFFLYAFLRQGQVTKIIRTRYAIDTLRAGLPGLDIRPVIDVQLPEFVETADLELTQPV